MSEDGASEWNYPQLPDNSTIMRADQWVELRWTFDLNELMSEEMPFADIAHIDLWLVDTQSRTKIHQICSEYGTVS